MWIAAAELAHPGVKVLLRVWRERHQFLSPPRKRDSGTSGTASPALNSRFRGGDPSLMSTIRRVVRRFAGHHDVVDVAFAQAGAGDAHELAFFCISAMVRQPV